MCGFNLQLVQLEGRFESSSLSGLLPHCPWVSTVVLFPSLYVGHPLGFAPEVALGDLGLPVRARCGGGAAALVIGILAAPGTQGSWELRQQEI